MVEPLSNEYAPLLFPFLPSAFLGGPSKSSGRYKFSRSFDNHNQASNMNQDAWRLSQRLSIISKVSSIWSHQKSIEKIGQRKKIKIVHFVWHYPLFVRTVILQGLDAVRRAVLQKRVVEGRFPKIQQRFSEIRPTPSRKQFFATPPRSSTYPRKMAIFSELPSLESSLTLAAQAKPSLLSHPAPASTLWWDTISLFSPQICKLSSRQGSELVLPGLQLNRGQRTTPTLASGLFFSFWFWHANIFKGRQRQMWPLRISTTTPRLIQWWTPTGWRRRM